MSQGKMTADEFEALQPRLGRLTVDTVKIARSVFVDGVRPVDAAAQHGTSRQRVNAIIRRFEEATREFPPIGSASTFGCRQSLPPRSSAWPRKLAEV